MEPLVSTDRGQGGWSVQVKLSGLDPQATDTTLDITATGLRSPLTVNRNGCTLTETGGTCRIQQGAAAPLTFDAQLAGATGTLTFTLNATGDPNPANNVRTAVLTDVAAFSALDLPVLRALPGA